MLPGLSVPPSLERLLAGLRPCFTAPSFATFCALVCGMLAQTGRRTVCGMLVGAGLSGSWSHHRAHKFFSNARWSPEDLSVALIRLVVRLLVPADAPVSVVIDDTLFTPGRRCLSEALPALSSTFSTGARGPAIGVVDMVISGSSIMWITLEERCRCSG
jgi:hypothetical protein